MKSFLIGMIAFLAASCSPTWSDCPTCVAADEAQEIIYNNVNIDNDVTVIVDVDTEVNVTYAPACTTCAPTPVCTTCTPPPPKDPPKCDRVCTCYKTIYKCDNGWHGDKSKCKGHHCTEHKKCVKEEKTCH